VLDPGTTGAVINDATFSASAPGTAAVRATVADGAAIGAAFTKDFVLAVAAAAPATPAFVPVTDIIGVPAEATAGTSLLLTALVIPGYATHRSVVWSVLDPGTTGAVINDATFSASAPGTAAVRATVADGAAVGAAFTQDFTLAVAAAAPAPPVKSGDASLASLTVSAGILMPEFAPDQVEYTVNVGSGVSGMTLTAVPADTKAGVTGDGARSLAFGRNTVTVTVTAEDGATRDYIIYVIRASSNGASSGGGSSASSASPGANAGTGGVTVAAPADKPPVNNPDGSATLPGGGTVTAGNGTRIAAPEGTRIAGDGTVLIPAGQTAAVDLPGSADAVIPGGSSVDKNGEISIAGGAGSLRLPGKASLTVPEGAVISREGAVRFPKGGGAVALAGGLSFSVRGDTVIIPDENTPLGYVVEYSVPIHDLRETDWFYDDMVFIYTHGLFKGTNEDPLQLDPASPLTYGMLTAVLARLADSDPSGNANAAVAASVNEAAETGLAADELFASDPDSVLTRQDLAVVFARYAQSMNMDPPAKTEQQSFADDGQIAEYARNAVYALRQAGIIGGKPDNLFDPLAAATRAETAAVLHRFITAAQ
jgi:hypothetical protein